jgi:hypothetical protein
MGCSVITGALHTAAPLSPVSSKVCVLRKHALHGHSLNSIPREHTEDYMHVPASSSPRASAMLYFGSMHWRGAQRLHHEFHCPVRQKATLQLLRTSKLSDCTWCLTSTSLLDAVFGTCRPTNTPAVST